MKGNVKIAIGAIGMLAAGITVGLLVAPRKGKKTRKKIKSMAVGCIDQLAGYLAKGKEFIGVAEDETREIKRTLD